TLLDTFARTLFDVPFDEDARLARNGRVDGRLLDALREEPFFAKSFPKTIGPELFSAEWVSRHLQHLPKGGPNPYDLIATLTRLTANTVSEALLRMPRTVRKQPCLYLSGGGAHNPLIREFLQENLGRWDIRLMDRLGVAGDAKEALLFAVLANETVAGQAAEGATLGGLPLVGMGKISFPD
ncbi:MAG TPA: anhydro-N-acetylmuramic acid kinase, partial [Saprospiraceae bacterium]|nr:anhydro-N-acetylmuramic acid kinase [Saprospiraceae bacterium]